MGREYCLDETNFETSLPTNSERVKDLLRKLDKPSIIFGENEFEKRERLKQILVFRKEKLTELIGKLEMSKSLGEKIEDKQNNLFYTEGFKNLKNVRMWITKYSLARARKRISLLNNFFFKGFKDPKSQIPFRKNGI